MKIHFSHLKEKIIEDLTIEEVSSKLFQLGHENEINNHILDIDITPNRGDCLSLNGILRELSVFYNVKQCDPIFSDNINNFDLNFFNKRKDICKNISFLKIDIEDHEQSYKKYLNKYFTDLDHKKNNFFTDVSNFISYETGQPTHCYDAKSISGQIIFDEISGNHVFKTLFNEDLKITNTNCVFLMNDEIINLAGIVGGLKTACSSKTRSVIVECAHFSPEHIIGKSVEYNIQSDASHKFERGVDERSHDYVLRRFLYVVQDHAKIKNIEIFTSESDKYKTKKINFDLDAINKILGTDIKENLYKDYLKRLNFNFNNQVISIPSYRNDISSQNDMAEEVARIIGFDAIEPQVFKISKTNEKPLNKENTIKDLLIQRGFYETINFPFTGQKSDKVIEIDNPLDSNKKYLRTKLQESLIENLLYNEKRQHESIKLFEISNIYYKTEDGIQSKRVLGIVASGRVAKNYNDYSKKIDQKYFSNILKEIFEEKEIEVQEVNRNDINSNSKRKSKIIYFERELDSFFCEKIKPSDIKTTNNFNKYIPVSDFPSSKRDLSFLITDTDRIAELEKVVMSYESQIIKEIFIFDYYQDEKNKSCKLGFSFIFQSNMKTLQDTEIDGIMNDIISETCKIQNVEIPGLS